MNAHQATSLPATSFASHKVLLFATLLLALLLRMYQIEQPFNSAFAWRQCSTAMMAENFYKGNWNILFPEVNWVGPGPGYQGREFQLVTYLAALLYRIFGQEEWVGRLVVISFSILGVFSLYQLVKRVWDEHHALAAAFVLAILPGSVYIDRSFLPDPAMVSLVIASLWQWITFLQTEKRKHLLVAAILACLGFLTKITGMIVCIPIIYAAFTALKSRGWPLKELKLIALTTSCVLVLVGAYYSWARYLSQTYPPYHFAGEGNWLWNFEPDYWITKRYFFERNFFHLKSRLWGLPFLLLAIVGISLRQNIIPGEGNIESPSGRKFKYLFHFWLLGCLIFYIIGARELSFNPWNFHIFSPAIAAFSGRALVAAFFFGSNRAKRLLTLTVILLFVLISNIYLLKSLYNYPYIRSDYAMGKELKKISKPGDLVVTFAADPWDPTSIYYSQQRGWVFPPYGKAASLSMDDTKNIAGIELLRNKGAQWFGIVGEQYEDVKTNHPDFATFLHKRYTLRVKTRRFVIFKL